MKTSRRGVALIELMIVVVALLVVSGVAVALLFKPSFLNRENITREKLSAIRTALIGNRELLVEKSQQGFGFVGDLGVFPANLTELIDQGNYPDFNCTNHLCCGWRGPYLSGTQENGLYVALLDGWGRPFNYQLAPGATSCQISSSGADGVFGTADDIAISITQNEAFLFVSGQFLSRVSKNLLTGYNSQIEIFYPGGLNGPVSSILNITGGVFDSSLTNLRLPIGLRYFQTTDGNYQKIVSINSGASAADQIMVTFIGEESAAASPGFELSFDSNDDQASNQRTDRSGSWQYDRNGNLVPAGPGDNRTFFGNLSQLWQDYRTEVNVTLAMGSGYGIYYRADGQLNVNGYLFQFSPADYMSGVALIVRKVINGSEQPPLQRLDLTSAQFQSRFNRPITNVSHQISITVHGSDQIIKLDGQVLFSFSDETFLRGNVGFLADSMTDVRFHFIQVHPLPPLPDGEVVWYKFEEGDGDTVYGSGFEIGAAENNGILRNGAGRDAEGVFGQCLRLDGQNDYLQVADALNLRLAEQISLEAWARPLGNNSSSVVLQKGNSNGYGLGMDRQQGWFGFITLAGGQRVTVNWGSGRPQTNRWYHLVLTYDGQNLKLYVNGLLSNTQTINGMLLTNSEPLVIGSNGGTADFFHGRIDEIVIYSRAINLTLISQRYQKYLP